MKIITLDFETFWDTGHTLTKMSPIEYIMHPKTEIQSCSIKVDKSPAQTYFGEDEIAEQFGTIDWANSMVIGHNMSGFDSMILAWRFGIYPKMWGCTQAMGRIHAKVTSTSLRKLSEFYGIGKKLSLEATNTKGKTLKDFTPREREAMRAYNDMDTELCFKLFTKLLQEEPFVSHRTDELALIDMTIKMLVEPQFEVDELLLVRTLKEERKRKHDTLVALSALVEIEGVDAMALDEEIAVAVKKALNSTAKFKALLEQLGVEVPMKTSPTTKQRIPAISKTDEEFTAMLEHENPLVAAAVGARLDTKSTILESRIESFLAATRAYGGKLPVTLKYNGADTTGRWSGWAYNPQNLPRVNPKSPKPSDALRNSLRAPAGYKVVVADLSGIELRVNHFLWQVPSSMALFQQDPAKADLYKDFASRHYGVPVDQVTKDQRQMGKLAHLSLGFSGSHVVFKRIARLMGGIELDEAEAEAVVYGWRQEYPEIVQGWATCQEALPYIKSGGGQFIDPWQRLLKLTKDGIQTPRGLIRYEKLRRQQNEETGKNEWVYGTVKKSYIYGGKVVENCVQHLARNVIADCALAVARTQIGRHYPLANMVHDELIYVVKEEDAEEMLAVVQTIMRTPPSWWSELVTWSEGDIADTYGAAK